MITRDNYEEYFLLYADNELPAAERRAVERFVAGHPDLREEWEALLQCRLSPAADVVFPGRASLMKPGSDESSFTEDILLYLDDELDEPGRARVEEVIRLRPSVAKELAELRQTVSSPDPAICFPDKAGLYKTERSRRIVVLPWIRAGIAAAIAGAIVVGLLLPAGRRGGSPANTTASTAGPARAIASPATPTRSTASTATPTRAIPSTAAPSTAGPSTAALMPSTPNQTQPAGTPSGISHTHNRYLTADVTSGAASALHNRTGKQPTPGPTGLHLAVASDATATLAATGPGKTGVQPDPVGTVALTGPPDVTTMAVTRPATGNPGAEDLAVNARSAAQHGIPKDQSSFATQALQEEANEERAGSLVSDETAAPAKAGLRGIFRKVTRAFGKTADRDDDGNRQVLVGAFQVPIN